MSVTRYHEPRSPVKDCLTDQPVHAMTIAEDGEWVRYEDFMALVADCQWAMETLRQIVNRRPSDRPELWHLEQWYLRAGVWLAKHKE